ncbi:hypothetical protein [Undibacterium oligocarboniphilum]|uniref:Uncharacterized protein n=1 Tax=Undibacterium oligocarboniphilum TaxID=666702 RepID=A0A850QD93_9BURK|nr:hypothetical protein [Undibacterium oligocarboniphilum]MBC3868857.1 hypothetical protein [Undibacterium oligocarboniphilum]NVO76837.1 hypothetical protein [Undibacterium oligocarboniphilum]
MMKAEYTISFPDTAVPRLHHLLASEGGMPVQQAEALRYDFLSPTVSGQMPAATARLTSNGLTLHILHEEGHACAGRLIAALVRELGQIQIIHQA